MQNGLSMPHHHINQQTSKPNWCSLFSRVLSWSNHCCCVMYCHFSKPSPPLPPSPMAFLTSSRPPWPLPDPFQPLSGLPLTSAQLPTLLLPSTQYFTVPHRFQWTPLDSSGFLGIPVDWVHWSPVESTKVHWIPQESTGVQWTQGDSRGLQWT